MPGTSWSHNPKTEILIVAAAVQFEEKIFASPHTHPTRAELVRYADVVLPNWKELLMQSAERIGWSENITKNATHALEERIKRMYWETPTRWYREHPRYPNTRRNKLYIAMKRAIEERRYNLMDPITDVTVRDLMQGD